MDQSCRSTGPAAIGPMGFSSSFFGCAATCSATFGSMIWSQPGTKAFQTDLDHVRAATKALSSCFAGKSSSKQPRKSWAAKGRFWRCVLQGIVTPPPVGRLPLAASLGTRQGLQQRRQHPGQQQWPERPVIEKGAVAASAPPLCPAQEDQAAPWMSEALTKTADFPCGQSTQKDCCLSLSS